jgi:hypothetical protein
VNRPALKTPDIVCEDSVEECATLLRFVSRSWSRGGRDEDASMLDGV